MQDDLAAPIVIRPGAPSDRSAVLALIEPFVERKKVLNRTVDELEGLLPQAFVAEIDGQVVGFVVLEVYSRKLAELRSLVVAPAHQGRGIGQRLVRACIERAQQQQILEVMAITSSEEFFRSCGFDYTLPDEKKAFFFQTRERH